jgi:3-hydroxybutyryl-CoA dehydratase
LSIKAGQEASFAKTITEADILLFAAVSGDTNPVHLDAVHAAGTRFGQRVAHGLLTGSLISAVLGTKLPGPGSIFLSQTFKFLKPVHIGDTITATVKVTSIRQDKPVITLAARCVNQHGESVLEGESVVLFEEV